MFESMTDRRRAVERLRELAEEKIERLLPPENHVLTFAEFEDAADELERALCPAFLRECVTLSQSLEVQTGGRCPHCGSDRVYLDKRRSEVRVLTPHGSVEMTQQHARCRSCDRSFSPSAA